MRAKKNKYKSLNWKAQDKIWNEIKLEEEETAIENEKELDKTIKEIHENDSDDIELLEEYDED